MKRVGLGAYLAGLFRLLAREIPLGGDGKAKQPMSTETMKHSLSLPIAAWLNSHVITKKQRYKTVRDDPEVQTMKQISCLRDAGTACLMFPFSIPLNGEDTLPHGIL